MWSTNSITGRLRWGLASVLMLASSMAAAIDRDQLEAAVVYNILQFVEWPGEEALQPGSPLTLCMDPDSPSYASMHQLSGRGLRRMQFVVEPLLPQTRRCNVVFVDSARSQRTVSTRQGAATDGALLVVAGSHFQPTEAPTIQLSEAGGKLAFDVFADKARAQGLVVSSRLLRLARKVSE